MVRDYSPCTEQSRKLQLEESLLDAIPLFVFPGRHFSTLVSVLSHICTPFAAAVGEKQVHIKRSFNLTFLFFFAIVILGLFEFFAIAFSIQLFCLFAPGGVTLNLL